MRLKGLLISVGVLLVMVAALQPVLFPPPSKVTRENAEHIKEGMTPTEVEAILGGPAGDYSTRPTPLPPLPVLYTTEDYRPELWQGDEGQVTVYFSPGPASRVIHVDPFHPNDLRVSPLELIRWRLARWWGRLFPPMP